MTAARSPVSAHLVEWSTDQLRARLGEALTVYVTAMRYPMSTVQQRAPMWLSHMVRPGWRCTVALGGDGSLLGIGYGYLGAPGQWWHEQVRRGLVAVRGRHAANEWMTDYFELTELHVRPDMQGHGIGESVLRRLLDGVSARRVLLSTPEGPTKAWRLYRRVGFGDLLRDYLFAGDPRPFAVLGRELPLEPPDRD
ncbi:Ribosomal protein S18 acetylase RimI [Streptoalloteichus tenebrarius]|uniref:Ribosomal protein S18 acetylase RimI n=1 Tax=Streptoalloteichus tenebrarius (strain ATCC 17920 / DSM 40477 / JCM 4838 / CBS 697.72 / NBRC 16177 / NCIMB 11028 / NRRL B-12390 / A12253. 1 / ISP 5477) TaxID=1933 RepID=A0ABT1HMK2_STRSD|nr:GNAT family N-acetyltransferase [Streptoalloteichus tenebrarius]MCP2256744.1 Ribosomal protein S18 acetylase RimI [Streptoalloteichus tenebrarius]BFF00353.1 GNAT family N-acetyltransferase [Streptoalloteichus tenebrarius]